MTMRHAGPRFLASVTSPEEALIAYAGGADLIDAKNPAEGAFGALPVDTVKAIRKALPSHVTVSATVGDLPCDATVIARAVEAMSLSGCDLIKIGFFPGGDARAVIASLGRLDFGSAGLVGLLLADLNPDFTLLTAMAAAGFAGVMVDTEGKAGGSLTDHLPPARIGQFIREVHKSPLFAGIAGSLRVSDLAWLVPLKPDVIGFRGALCRQADRVEPLDPARVRAVRAALDEAVTALEGGDPAKAAAC